LVEAKTSSIACAPNTVLTARVSIRSPTGVEVPWALM